MSEERSKATFCKPHFFMLFLSIFYVESSFMCIAFTRNAFYRMIAKMSVTTNFARHSDVKRVRAVKHLIYRSTISYRCLTYRLPVSIVFFHCSVKSKDITKAINLKKVCTFLERKFLLVYQSCCYNHTVRELILTCLMSQTINKMRVWTYYYLAFENE